MTKIPTVILRAVIGVLGCIVLGLCVFGLPQLISSEMADGADFDYGVIFLGLYVTAIPFFIALFQALKLLNLIDKNRAFSHSSARAIKNIKYCAFAISGMFFAGMPYIFNVADKDDAPGLVALGLIIIVISFAVGAFASVMLRLVLKAIEIKSENDLTV